MKLQSQIDDAGKWEPKDRIRASIQEIMSKGTQYYMMLLQSK